MSNITVFMKNGETKNFNERGRPGGSWHNSIRYEGQFAIITDEYEKQIAIPAADILELIQDAPRRGW